MSTTMQKSPRATPDELRAAFAAVLIAQRDLAIQAQRAAHQKLLSALTLEPVWKSKLEEALPDLEKAALKTELLSDDALSKWVNQAMDQYKDIKWTITAADVASGEMKNPENLYHKQLWRFGRDSSVWKKDQPSAFKTWDTDVAAAINKVIDLQTVAANQLASLHTTLDAYIGELNARKEQLAALKADPRLAAVNVNLDNVAALLGPMTGHIEQSVVSAMEVKANGLQGDLAAFIAKPFSALDHVKLNSDLADAVSRLQFSATSVYGDSPPIVDSILQLDVDGIAAKKMKDKFGVIAYFVLASMQPSVIKRWFDLYNGAGAAADFQLALSEQVPLGSGAKTLLSYINAALAERVRALDVIKKLPASPVVPVPTGVKTSGEIKVNRFTYPASFSANNSFVVGWGGLKHVFQETGRNPTKKKLEAYLAELVAACGAAKKEWVKAGKPVYAKNEFTVVKNEGWTAIWKLRMRTILEEPYTLVYHIDSGYENSPRVNFVPK